MVYTSPNFNGLTIGMSYAPEGSAMAALVPGGATDDATMNMKTGEMVGQMSEHTAIGVSYSTAFMEGGSLNIGLGYEVASNEMEGAMKMAKP